jgi:hypothetical protein
MRSKLVLLLVVASAVVAMTSAPAAAAASSTQAGSSVSTELTDAMTLRSVVDHAKPTTARESTAAAATWHWIGWYPDPVLCVLFGASTGLPYQCRYSFPISWDLYVWY